MRAAGENTLYGTAQDTLLVLVHDTDDSYRNLKSRVKLVPDLKINLFSIVAVTVKGLKTVISKEMPFLNLGLFSVQLSRSNNIDHLDLATAKGSLRTESAQAQFRGNCSIMKWT